MKNRTPVIYSVWLTIVSLLLWQPAAGVRVPIPSEVFYYQPAASVFGGEAVWINPAGLAVYRASSWQLMADYYNNSFAKSWGSVVNREGIGLAHRTIDNPDGEDYREFVLGMAMPLGKDLSLGGSYRHFSEGPGIYHKRHFWNVGVIYRPQGNLSWGAVLSNLNRGKVDGERSEIEQRYSLAYRPLGQTLTFSVDMFLSTEMKLSNADYVYHLEVNAARGLYLSGYIDSDRNFQIGVRANLLQYFTGIRFNADKHGNHRGTTGIVGASSMRQPSLLNEAQRRLSVSMTGPVRENPPRPVIGASQTSFVTLLLNIYRAAADPSIGEMVISMDRVSIGFSQAQELREALTCFRKAGKKVTCHLSYPNNLAYYIGSACDRILIPPVSQLNLVGLRAELTFYAGTLEKLGVNIELLRIGDYKTAAETYTRKSASDENRAQVNRLLDDLYDQFVGAIALGRGVSPDSVRALVDGGPYTSADALKYGLVDGLSYRDELSKSVLSRMPEIAFRKYVSDTVTNESWRRLPVVAVVVADGEVAFGDGGFLPSDEDTDVTPSRMKKAFGRAAKDAEVRGLLLRINSPGGLALAGDEIYHTAAVAAQKKPLVVSMSNVAASGGYYIAMPAGQVFANPASVTGSIGIYGGKADFSRLYEKIDLNKELYTRGKFAGMLTTMRPFTDEEREKYFSQLRAMYEHFLGLVADNRNLPVDSIDNLARGRVWTGREAAEIGLVDRLGGLKEALDYTAERLGLKDYRVEILPEKRPFIIWPGRSLFSDFTRVLGLQSDRITQRLNPIVPAVTDGILARLPYDIEIE